MYPFTPESNRHVALWGDSLTFQCAPYIASVTLAEVFNCGVGGDTSTQIKTRFMAAPPEQIAADAMVIWAGRNNYSSMSTVEADVASMVALAPSNYLVLAVLNGQLEPFGVTGYDDILAINASLAATYGDRYWDVRSYLVSQHDQSEQDLTDFANDVPPTSLVASSPHLNAAGYTLVAEQLKSKLGL